MGRKKNVVKGENAGCQHFSPFPTMFSKGFFFRVIKRWDSLVRVKDYYGHKIFLVVDVDQDQG